MPTVWIGFAGPQYVRLPVEVRSLNLALEARAVSGDSIELPPGFHFVFVRLPDGSELQRQIHVADSADDSIIVEMGGRSPRLPRLVRTHGTSSRDVASSD